MSVHAISDAGRSAAVRPAPTGRSRARRRAGLTPVPDPAVEPVTLTISVSLRDEGDRERLIDALRDLVQVGGPETAVALPAPPASGARPRARRAARPVVIHTGTRTVLHDGAPVALSRLEYELLLFLVRRPEQVFTRAQLLAKVWGHTFASERTVDVHIRRLRMKLGHRQPLFTTVHGVGYRMADDSPVDLLDQ